MKKRAKYRTIVTYVNGDLEVFDSINDPSNPNDAAEWMRFSLEDGTSPFVVMANVRRFDFRTIDDEAEVVE